jgi:signal transduction histidine kinase/FixJ family two-component response regulator
MNDAILFVAGAPASAHAAWRDGYVALDQGGLRALLDGAAAADEPQVVIFAPTLAHPLQLARRVRTAWHLCELVFVAGAADYERVRTLLGWAPMIGPHWSVLRDGDPAFDQVVAEAAGNARRRARLRTTLERANVRIAAPRPIEEATYRRLQLAAHFMVNVLAQTKDGIVGLDTGLRVIQWNDSAARQWRVAPAQALALNGRQLPFWNADVAEAVARVLDGAAATSREHVYTIDGGQAFMDIAVSAVRDDGGQLIGVSLVIRDATDRHARLEQERARGAEIARSLEEKRRQLADMFDLAPGFMAVTRGADHVFEMANRAYADLFGKRTLAPVSVRAAFPELQGQSFVALRDQVYATGIAFVGKAMPVSLREADGRRVERFLDFVYQPLYDADGRISGIFCQGHDVTEQKQLQDGLLLNQVELESLVARRTHDLRQANLALHQAQKLEAIGKLTGGVAHDFNNILQVIGSNLDLMGLAPGLDDVVRRRLAGSMGAVERGAKLSAQLLAFARRQPLQPVATSVAHILRDMEELMRRALGEAIEIALAIDPRLWNTMIDRNQLENVILNLAINARDAMEGSGKLTIELGNTVIDDGYVAARADVVAGEYVVMAVSDNGAGMSAAVIERAFEPFYTTKPEGQGTGLGLSMAYGFVKQSGGHIAIYSEPGEGSTIRIYLPRSHAAEHAVALCTGPDAAGGSETILVVEDDAAVRLAVSDMLAGLGYTVLTAGDAQSALDMLERGAAPDLLFTDVVMPGTLHSPELARHARRLLPAIGVLFTSGYTQNAIVHAGRLDAGVELLSKPYRRSELAAKVRQVLGKRAVAAPVAAPEPHDAPARRRIVVVEDNDDARDMLRELLLILDFEPLCFGSAEGVLDALRDHDTLLTDVTLPGMSGSELARLAVERVEGLRVVFASGRSVEPQGFAARVLSKPFTLDQLSEALS